MSAEQKHTPTPWRVDARASTRIVAGDDVTVATTACQGDQRDMWENNASLIVRAVNSNDDMLAALQLAEDVLSRAPASTRIWPNGMHPNDGVERIRAAIAKATGAQS
jgi:hypothetical protein